MSSGRASSDDAVGFLSYRYYRSYEYYAIAETAYEAITIAAFLALLLVYIGRTPEEQRTVLKSKEKRKLPCMPCIRYRPGKPYALYALRASVLQYAFIRPILSIVGIICEALNVLCVQEYSYKYAEVYIEAVDFVSISVALYGLVALYTLTKDNLKGRSPLNKFLAIKVISSVARR